jgi:tetratricopeptide (TPR) repeat protein
MAKIGRNDPCPCGSGKKYKRCCIGMQEKLDSFDENEKRALLDEMEKDAAFLEEVDELSNRVPDLVRKGRFDEAEAVCRELIEKFPGMPDGLQRYGLVNEKRGNKQLAADYYRRAATFESKDYELDPEAKAALIAKANALDPTAAT